MNFEPSPLVCTKCGKNIAACECEDAEERLKSAGGPNGVLIYRKCKKCQQHYAFCQCEEPEWVRSDNDEPLSTLEGKSLADQRDK